MPPGLQLAKTKMQHIRINHQPKKPRKIILKSKLSFEQKVLNAAKRELAKTRGNDKKSIFYRR